MSTTQVNLLSFTQLADTTARVVADGYKYLEDLQRVKGLFTSESVPAGTGTQRIFTSYVSELYAGVMSEGGDAALASHAQGRTKTMNMRRFGKNVEVTHVGMKFANTPKVVTQLTALGQFIPQRQALDCTHRFTFADSTSYTDMDGATVDLTIGDDTRAVIYSAHTLTASSTTYSNIVTGNPVFSKGAFEVAKLITNTQMLDDFGNRIVMDFNTVVTTDDPSTIDSVNELLNSTTNPTQNNSGVVNTWKGSFMHVVLPRLATTATGAYDSTKAKRWFYMAVGTGSSYWDGRLGIWEDAYSVSEDVSIANDNMTFGTRGAWGLAVVTGRGIVMSTGLGV